MSDFRDVEDLDHAKRLLQTIWRSYEELAERWRIQALFNVLQFALWVIWTA